MLWAIVFKIDYAGTLKLGGDEFEGLGLVAIYPPGPDEPKSERVMVMGYCGYRVSTSFNQSRSEHAEAKYILVALWSWMLCRTLRSDGLNFLAVAQD